MPQPKSLFSIGGCPACPGSGDVIVLHAIHSNRAVFYCPACQTAWECPPNSHELNEVRGLDEVAPLGIRLPTEEEVANLKLIGISAVDFGRWASAIKEIINPQNEG